MTTQVYRGTIALETNGEEDNLVAGLSRVEGLDDSRWIAEIIAEDIKAYGSYLTVRHWTATQELSLEVLKEQAVRQVMGLGNAMYDMAYSEMTGYLWTDEKLSVGGHDLLEELRSNAGLFCHLEIEYYKAPQPGVVS